MFGALAGLVLGVAGPLTPAHGAPVSSVAVDLSPSSVPADGSSLVKARATVTLSGAPLVGQSVSWSTNGDVTFTSAPCTTDANGQCTVTIKASTTPGPETIKATNATDSSTGTSILDEFG